MSDITPISEELDALTCDLLAQAIKDKTDGEQIWPLAVIETMMGHRDDIAFVNDEPVECLNAAHKWVKEQAEHQFVTRYALVYEAEVMPEGSDDLKPALIAEFAEQGMGTGFSAYVLYEYDADTENFVWSQPLPAGETEFLLA